jgi:hypothetical protein
MQHFIWKAGEPPERSFRNKSNNTPENIALTNSHNFNKNIAKNMGINQETFSKNETELIMNKEKQKINKRDNLNNKLNDRYMLQQTKQNPYFHKSDYIKDLDVQESFLRPKSSNGTYQETI